jgi:mercuric ion transport protein
LSNLSNELAPVSGSTDSSGSSAPALALAGIAALLASSCCVLPLVFALVGISGTWIVYMRVLEPYSPALIALALLSLGIAGWRLYRPSRVTMAACDADGTACGQLNGVARRWFWLVLVVALVPLVVPLAAPLFY